MDVMRIDGGHPLSGTVQISGAKNAALPLFAATLLTAEKCRLEGIPDLADIRFMAELIQHLGAKVERPEPGVWEIQAQDISSFAPYELVRKMRASVCLMGPLIGRLGEARVSLPGGCVIGPRPIDIHLKGFARLGCEISMEEGYVNVDGKQRRGTDMFLGGRYGSTVLGTANLLMAAVLTPGRTRIESAACEPEVVDLCRMLVKMGAKIEGIGSHALVVEGQKALTGCTHRVIPDRIEAGTYLLATAMTGGDVTLRGAQFEHLSALVDKMEEANAGTIEIGSDYMRIRSEAGAAKPVDIITHPHPGFPTDLQAQFMALMTVTRGISVVTERIYPHRFMHVPELQRMGADIALEGASAIVKGGVYLSGAPVMASDLRASAALVMAGLAAKGESWVQRIYHLDRGYEQMEVKLSQLGARVERLSEKEMPKSLQAGGE
jgi:UDP-N-acetylglucosamine 1-carboxyvinyltransferase